MSCHLRALAGNRAVILGPTSLLAHLQTVCLASEATWVSCVLPSDSVAQILFPSGCFYTAIHSPLPGTDLQGLSFSPQPLPVPADCVSAWEHRAMAMIHLCRSVSVLAVMNWFLCSALRLWNPFCPGWSPCWRGDFLGLRSLSSFTALSQGHWSRLNSFFTFFFCLSYLVIWRFSCSFRSLRSFASI